MGMICLSLWTGNVVSSETKMIAAYGEMVNPIIIKAIIATAKQE